MSGVSGVTTPVEGDRLDSLVAEASKPSLATLFQRAKAKGLITPITMYGPNKERPSESAAPQGAPNQPPLSVQQQNTLLQNAPSFNQAG